MSLAQKAEESVLLHACTQPTEPSPDDRADALRTDCGAVFRLVLWPGCVSQCAAMRKLNRLASVRRWVLAFGVFAGLLFGYSCSNVSTSALLCEDAAARIYTCCDNHAEIACDQSTGCGVQDSFPPEVAKCIRAASCAQISASGLCEVPTWLLEDRATCQQGRAVCFVDGRVTTCDTSIQQACKALGNLQCS